MKFEEVMAYTERRARERGEALVEMVRLSEEMGLYEPEAEGKLGWPAESGAAPS